MIQILRMRVTHSADCLYAVRTSSAYYSTLRRNTCRQHAAAIIQSRNHGGFTIQLNRTMQWSTRRKSRRLRRSRHARNALPITLVADRPTESSARPRDHLRFSLATRHRNGIVPTRDPIIIFTSVTRTDVTPRPIHGTDAAVRDTRLERILTISRQLRFILTRTAVLATTSLKIRESG